MSGRKFGKNLTSRKLELKYLKIKIGPINNQFRKSCTNELFTMQFTEIVSYHKKRL
jgi:hypothetical protein